MEQQSKVTFQPSGRTIHVRPGTRLLEAAGRVGIVLRTPCGGQGTCGKCRVCVSPPEACPPSAACAAAFPAKDVETGFRLACQASVGEVALTVDIPNESLFESSHRILETDSGQTSMLAPVARKCRFELPPPTAEDARSDVTRLSDALGGAEIPYPILTKLPGFLRANDWQGTAVLLENTVIALEVTDHGNKLFGVAFDLGTTTIVGTLFDLTTGRKEAVSSLMNPQVAFGDDVISRISRVHGNHGALRELQQCVCNALNTIITELTEQSRIASRYIYEITVAGNSTMQQLLAGLDPSALGSVPFVPTHQCPLSIPTRDLGLLANPGAQLYMFPQIGGFVGGDTVAGVLAARLLKNGSIGLLVDIGTNGEIVLAHEGRGLAASTAAGPAFEGARIAQGMRATTGAIDKIVLDDDVHISTIDDARPVGICGTALIDIAAELLRVGVLDSTGRILSADEAPADLPPAIRARLVSEESETHFVIVPAEHAAGESPIRLHQRDIRELQLATGAIRAGINILLRQAGLTPADLDHVLLAGAFGNFIRRRNAQRIGLLPPVEASRVQFIGNAASLGAKLVLLSNEEREDALRISTRITHVDLSLDLNFQMEFADAMMFPEQ